jgi:hypothetical protein
MWCVIIMTLYTIHTNYLMYLIEELLIAKNRLYVGVLIFMYGVYLLH